MQAEKKIQRSHSGGGNFLVKECQNFLLLGQTQAPLGALVCACSISGVGIVGIHKKREVLPANKGGAIVLLADFEGFA